MTTTATQRTDIHAPSRINPAEYFCIGWEYLGQCSDPFEAIAYAEERKRIREHMQDNGWTWSHHEHGGTCGICGASAMYLAIFVHKPTGRVIRVGETCANKMELADKGMFKTAHHALEIGREYATGRKRCQQALGEYGLAELVDWFYGPENAPRKHGGGEVDGLIPPAFTGSNSDEEAIRAWQQAKREWYIGNRKTYGKAFDDVCWSKDTLNDMLHKLSRYGDWSEKQQTFARKLWDRISNWKAWATEQKAQHDAEVAAAANAPSGRAVITGTVLSKQLRESAYGSTWKLLIQDDSGWKGWTTEPSGLNCDKGDRITLTADWTPSDDDPKFAFGKRPTRAGRAKAKAE